MIASDHDDRWHDAVDLLCSSSARQILEGISFADFSARMVGMLGTLLKTTTIPDAARTPELLRRMATVVALEIWNATPIPENRFRPRKQPRPERNAPCLCGSGHKFKQCCGAVNAPALGISEELMLAKVLMQFPRNRLAELPILELHPGALALVADDWRQCGREKDAIALLEILFAHLPELDERAEGAADMLLGAYLDTNAPRKKQKFIEALKEAPDKTLASTGWQRQTTVLSDRGDYAGAWAAFREAQRLTPNAPSLSHLEILVLVSEGRREEARARAAFWSAKLGRDAKYDHRDLIALLRDMADGSDDSTLRSLAATRGPLARLAEIIERWPPPACAYSLAGDVELVPDARLAACEGRWVKLRDGMMDHDKWLDFLAREPLAGQSFRVLRDSVEILGMLPEGLPGSNDALARRLLERGEALRRTVLGKLHALDRELAWGFLDNRPLLTLVAYYVEEFAAAAPAETLDLLRWSVGVANPSDNTGLRETLIHALVAGGLADEAIAVAARYPDDFASTEYARVLAFFAAGRRAEAEAALKQAAARWPKVWKTLHAANPRASRMTGPGITVGGADEAYEYRARHLDLWRSTGALRWGSGIRVSAAAAGRKAVARPEDDKNGNLF